MPVTFKGSRLATALLRLLGWRLDFAGFPTPQGVAVVYPHTSNWDFVVGMLAKWALGVPANYLAKDSLFRIPLLGRWMRWVGGIGIERSAAHGLVGQMTEVYAQAKATNRVLWLGVTPEGTRGLTPGWRTGFYQMAFAAQVPLALVKFDWGRKRISIEDFFWTTGDVQRDFEHIAQVYEGVQGCRAHLACPIQPWSPRPNEAQTRKGTTT